MKEQPLTATHLDAPIRSHDGAATALLSCLFPFVLLSEHAIVLLVSRCIRYHLLRHAVQKHHTVSPRSISPFDGPFAYFDGLVRHFAILGFLKDVTHLCHQMLKVNFGRHDSLRVHRQTTNASSQPDTPEAMAYQCLCNEHRGTQLDAYCLPWFNTRAERYRAHESIGQAGGRATLGGSKECRMPCVWRIHLSRLPAARSKWRGGPEHVPFAPALRRVVPQAACGEGEKGD